MLSRIKTYLTPLRRKATYGAITVVTVALVAFNVVSADQINQAVESLVSILAALTTLLASLNTGSGADQSWW